MANAWFDPYDVEIPSLGDLSEKDYEHEGQETTWSEQSNKDAYEL